MNSAVATEEIGTILQADHAPAFFAARPRKSARELTGSTDEVFRGMSSVLEQQLTDVIQKRTTAEFNAAYAEAFPKYVEVILALSRFAEAVIPSNVVKRLQWEAFCELEGDFREHGIAAFGKSVQEQSLFTIWTLRKINALVRQIVEAKKLDEPMAKTDKEYFVQYMVNTLRANFSLDCLNIALQSECAVYPEVLDELTDGLRSAVNAYAWTRRAAELRAVAPQPVNGPTDWDDEDEALLRESNSEFYEERA